MHDGDGLVQVRLRVELLDGGIVPVGDLAVEDLAERLAVEVETLADALDVVGPVFAMRVQHERDVQDGTALGRGQFGVQHRRVAGAEVDRSCAQFASQPPPEPMPW